MGSIGMGGTFCLAAHQFDHVPASYIKHMVLSVLTERTLSSKFSSGMPAWRWVTRPRDNCPNAGASALFVPASTDCCPVRPYSPGKAAGGWGGVVLPDPKRQDHPIQHSREVRSSKEGTTPPDALRHPSAR
ncbi:hypothetical protein GCM10027605_00850 [Micromonospora zhanjiangensis]